MSILPLVVAAIVTGGVDAAAVDAIHNEAEARAAVKAVTDADSLADIAAHSSKWRLRADAVYFLSDQSVVAKALADKDWQVRVSAVRKLADVAVLKKVAGSDSEERVRAAAVMRIPDREFLEKLAKTEKSELVRKFITKRLPAPVVVKTLEDLPKAKETTLDAITVRK